jgi:hypothetical protein
MLSSLPVIGYHRADSESHRIPFLGILPPLCTTITNIKLHKMRNILIGIFILSFFSCDKKNQENDIELLVSKIWIEISPKPSISIGWNPFPVECPDSICPDKESVQFNTNGIYIREIYCNTSPRFQQQNLQFLKLNGTWRKNNNEIYLYPASVIEIDHREIPKDSIYWVEKAFYNQLYENTEFDSINNIVNLSDKWIIEKLSNDSLIIRLDPFGTNVFISEN